MEEEPEGTRRQNRCGLCQQVGHNRARCPGNQVDQQPQPERQQEAAGPKQPIYHFWAHFKITNIFVQEPARTTSLTKRKRGRVMRTITLRILSSILVMMVAKISIETVLTRLSVMLFPTKIGLRTPSPTSVPSRGSSIHRSRSRSSKSQSIFRVDLKIYRQTCVPSPSIWSFSIVMIFLAAIASRPI